MGSIVIFAGGTGGAKLARGMLDVVGRDLTVIANTADDIEIYDTYVSPDPDLITFWLADQINQRGWGLRNDTFNTMEKLRKNGIEVWFNLGDQDFELCQKRKKQLHQGRRLTEIASEISKNYNVDAKVLPMSDDFVRTKVKTKSNWFSLQEFLIKQQAQQIEDVKFEGIEKAKLTDEVREAITNAKAIIIGPSNPVISIEPILALSEMRHLLNNIKVPIVAVGPIVQGEVIKGPTKPFLKWAGFPATNNGVAKYYGNLINGFVSDESTYIPNTYLTDLSMHDQDNRKRLANEILEFCEMISKSTIGIK